MAGQDGGGGGPHGGDGDQAGGGGGGEQVQIHKIPGIKYVSIFIIISLGKTNKGFFVVESLRSGYKKRDNCFNMQ